MNTIYKVVGTACNANAGALRLHEDHYQDWMLTTEVAPMTTKLTLLSVIVHIVWFCLSAFLGQKCVAIMCIVRVRLSSCVCACVYGRVCTQCFKCIAIICILRVHVFVRVCVRVWMHVCICGWVWGGLPGGGGEGDACVFVCVRACVRVWAQCFKRDCHSVFLPFCVLLCLLYACAQYSVPLCAFFHVTN